MLKQHKILVRNTLLTADILVILLAFFLSFRFRQMPFFMDAKTVYFNTHYWMGIVAVPVWCLFLYFQDMYKSQRILSYTIIFWRLIKTTFTSALILGSLVFIFQIKSFSRSLFIIFLTVSLIMLTLERVLIKAVSNSIRKRGYNFRNILLVGKPNSVKKLVGRIEQHPEWSLRILGYLVPADSKNNDDSVSEIPRLGTSHDLIRIAQNNVIDEIIFCIDSHNLDALDRELHICEEMGIRTHIVADFFKLLIAKTELGYLEDIPLLTFTTTPHRDFHLFIKRLMDLFLSAILLILFMPLMIFIAILIKLDPAKGPVLFKQTRVGVNGRLFQLLKFRSMVVGAENLLPNLQIINEMNGPVFKATKDPRITRTGKLLRKYSLDELPQLVNVFKGDMSLVGPRPPLPKEVEMYERWQRRRLSMKPGLTCIWQISGRNEIDFEEWMRMDLDYIDHWTLGLDLKILIKTIPAILSGKGAR
ncbi:sugar transferase [bacterium]|nr:sugar transferase [candidate division CSSED10-310 bacterium]